LRLDSPGPSSQRPHWRNLLLFSCLLMPMGNTLAAIPAEWKNTAYAYEAEHKPLREVLEDFAQTFGTQLQVEGLLEGNVNGKIRANTRSRCSTGWGWNIASSGTCTTTPSISAPWTSKNRRAWRCLPKPLPTSSKR
jgi:hypothetical protein